MKWTRPALLAFLLVPTLAGCRTAGLGNLAQPSPAPSPSRSGMKAGELLADHNRNAERIQSLEAKPEIKATFDGKNGGLSSRLSMERPRNFKLEVSTSLTTVADVGSNLDEFWFWVSNRDAKAEKAIYFCKYEDLDRSPLAATFQPDWITEAMGLRVISPEEAEEIEVKPGEQPGTLVLTHPPSRSGGKGFTRVTVIDEKTRRIIEHQVYSTDQNKPLARAVVANGLYRSYPLTSADGTPAEPVFLPGRVKLEWVQEKLALEVTLAHVKINPRFSPEVRAARFVEPQRKDCARRNLAETSEVADDSTTIRETRPAPPTRVRLGEPSPEGFEGARRPPREPIALSADLPEIPPYRDSVVGPPIPSAPSPEFLRADKAGWRSAPPGLER